MTDARAVRSRGNRRDFLKTSAAAVAAGAYGLSWWPARAAGDIPLEYDGSKF
jgi:anaerobic selenocysteine-containing dehydrogenase